MVLSRTRASCTGTYTYKWYDPIANGDCLSVVKRTIWDGSQIAWEIQSEGQDDAQDAIWYGAHVPEMLGRVGYIHGGGLDQPLGVLRYDYMNSGPNVYTPTSPLLVVPHYTWRVDAWLSYICGGTGCPM